MSARKLVLMVALVLPSVALVAIPGSASASASRTPTPTGTGTLTCSVGGYVSFDPPLTQNGTPPETGAKSDAVEVVLQLTNCSGPDSNTPQPNPTGATENADRTHLKNTRIEYMGHQLSVVGGCGFDDFNPEARIRNTVEWTGESPVARTHTKLEVDTTGGNASGTSTGSYSGTGSGTLNLTADSEDDYNSVCNESGGGSISSLQFDPSTSTLTIGEPAT